MNAFLPPERRGIVIVILIAGIAASLVSEAFLTTTNLLNVLRQISITGMLAVGLTFVIITSGIDLSVGAIVALTSVLVAAAQPWGLLPAVGIGLLAGVTVGTVNGVGIAYWGVPPFIMTLATMYAVRGAAFLHSGGLPVYGLSGGFVQLGNSSVLGVPVAVFYLAACLAASAFLLHWTPFGRYVFAIGSNEVTTRLSGVNVKLHKAAAYVLSGVLAALGGVVYTSQLGIGVALAGQGYELNAIAAVAIGGTPLAGGTGSLLASFLGAAVVGIGNNLLNLTRVDPMLQDLFRGVIIPCAVLLNRRST